MDDEATEEEAGGSKERAARMVVRGGAVDGLSDADARRVHQFEGILSCCKELASNKSVAGCTYRSDWMFLALIRYKFTRNERAASVSTAAATALQ